MMKLWFRKKRKTKPNIEKRNARKGILTLLSVDYSEAYAEQFDDNDYAMRMTVRIMNRCDAMMRLGGRMW